MTLLDHLARSYGADYKQMAAALDMALKETDRLRAESARLRAENRHLRRRLADRDLRLLRHARRDALYLAALHFAGCPTTRRASVDVGLTERRWHWGMALLRTARVHNGLDWTGDTPIEVETAIGAAVELTVQLGVDRLRSRNTKRC